METDPPERTTLRIRRAVVGDRDVLARHRLAMFAEMNAFPADGELARRIEASTRDLLAGVLPTGEWVGWVAEDGEGIAGSGSAILRRLPPCPVAPSGGELAYLLNFYVEERARRRGVATEIMRVCLEWCRERGVGRIELHASDAGRRVYEKLGFKTRTNEMVYVPQSSDAVPGERQ
jgi:GNAT superfamily N-acetyltransferase